MKELSIPFSPMNESPIPDITKKKVNLSGAMGQLHVHSSFNNIVSLANSEGQIISWSSAGKMGFRGSKKNTLRSPDGRSGLRQSSLRPWSSQGEGIR